MEMQLLRCFVAVGEERHISNAAERLRVAAPTLSEAIQRLEYGLGLRLFVRLRHGVALTPAGHAFLPVARRVVTEFDEGVRMARIAEAQAARVLRVGYVCRVDPELISAITAEFQSRRREWRLKMRRADPSDPAAGSRDEVLDGGNAVTLLRLPVSGGGRLEGRLEGRLAGRRDGFAGTRDPRAGASHRAQPFSIEPSSAEPLRTEPHRAEPSRAEPHRAEPFLAGSFMATPDTTGTLREFLLTAEKPADQASRPAPDALDVGDWFGAAAVAHQAIGIITETSVAGPPGSTGPAVEAVSPSVLSAVWPRGDTDPVIADFLQACIAAVRDHAPGKGP